LKTSLLYQWILHPMYVGSCSLSGAAPRMTIGLRRRPWL